jgi:hypothetical protein
VSRKNTKRHGRRAGWDEAHVRRLFWRAGFGATPREARHWARRGKSATIRWLLNGGVAPVPRIAPARVDGRPLDPVNEWGRSHVPVGRVRFNVHNFGEDGHDLAIRNRRGKLLGAMPELEPAGNNRLAVRLRRPGRYTVFCSLEGHEARGMRSVLRAERPQRGR